MKTFEELGLSKQVLDTLEGLGFKEPTDIQEQTIPLALAGKDIIGGSATGSGKTLAFASPIMENLEPNGTVQSLIMAPTRELAEQVAESIKIFSKNKGLKVLPVYGGASIETQIKRLPRTDVVVGTPGRILDHLKRRTLRLDGVKILVLDEVDRMFDMGFKNDVEKIIDRCPSERQTMLFSATISSGIDFLAKKHTKNAIEVAVESHIDHDKLKQVYYDVQPSSKFSLLIHLLKDEKSDLVMVFCNTRRSVDYVTKHLSKNGMEAVAIHGGLTQNKRTRILSDFHNKGTHVLVCTDVAARGLDIKGVSHVYNYDIPKTSDEYVHRIGRTARAGEEGKAINIVSSNCYENFRNVKEDDLLRIDEIKLPEFEKVRIESERRSSGFNRGGRSGGWSGGRSNSGGRSFGGRSSGGRSSGGRSFGGRRDSRTAGEGRRNPQTGRFGGRSSGSSEGGSRDPATGRFGRSSNSGGRSEGRTGFRGSGRNVRSSSRRSESSKTRAPYSRK
jgi:ATP-dependent RNA helicase DeaD